MSFAQFVERRLFQPAESDHAPSQITYTNNSNKAQTRNLHASIPDACRGHNNCATNLQYLSIKFKNKGHGKTVRELFFYCPDITGPWKTSYLISIKVNRKVLNKENLVKHKKNGIIYYVPK